jgi:ABC-2 type transport system permease protein
VLVALVLLGTLALGSWGFALAGLLRAEATLAVANGIFLLLLFAGGTVLPTDRLPGPLAGVAGLLPSAALGDGLRAVLDPALAGALPWAQVAILAMWAVAGVAVAVRTFRWE